MEWHEYIGIFLNLINFIMLLAQIIKSQTPSRELSDSQLLNRIDKQVHRFDHTRIDIALRHTEDLWQERTRRRASLEDTTSSSS